MEAGSENERLARSSLEALFRGEFDSWTENLDPDVIYVPTREWFEAAPLRGPDSARQFMEQIWEDWGEWDAKIRDVQTNDDRVLVETRIRAVGAKSGIELRGRTFHVLTIRNGRIIQMQDFIEPDEAFTAAGLAGGD